MKPYVRVIDRRNNWYGTYKYQLRLSSFLLTREGNTSAAIRTWLAQTFGPEYTIDMTQPYWCKQRNDQWHTQKKTPRSSTPILYLKGDEELNIFLLRWA